VLLRRVLFPTHREQHASPSAELLNVTSILT
jgi:hypothetical protein